MSGFRVLCARYDTERMRASRSSSFRFDENACAIDACAHEPATYNNATRRNATAQINSGCQSGIGGGGGGGCGGGGVKGR